MEELVSVMTDDDGNWSSEIIPGRYLLQIGDGEGSIWHSATLEVGDFDVHHSVVISTTKVLGRVRLGDEAVKNAKLIFGGEHGLEQVHLMTDGQGEFAGEVPTKDGDQATWTVSVESDEPAVKRTAEYVAARTEDGSLRFEINLPKTVVRGRVVDEDGVPSPNAIVTLRSAEGEGLEQSNTEADGHFELHGLESGRYRVHAESFLHSSEILYVEASEKEAAEIEIVLRKVVLVTGRVQSRSTAGVIATLTALQQEVKAEFVPSTTTDSDGRFELLLPPKTRIFDLIVNAPGFALATGRFAIQDRKALTLTLDQSGGILSIAVPHAANAVIRHDGAEYPARWLATSSGGSVHDDADGDSIRFANVEAGEYVVCAGATCRQGVVPAGGALALSIP